MIAPVRSCCGQRHVGPMCPDGLVMCCHCFERFPVEGLSVDDDGARVDVCVACDAAEKRNSGRRGVMPDARESDS